MADLNNRRHGFEEGGGGGGVGGGDGQPGGGPANLLETRAIAYMSCENLRGTDNWAWLCPAIFVLSVFVSMGWLWNTTELVLERKGYVFMGLMFTAYAVMVLSKRIRDEQYADLLLQYGTRTRFYHESTVKHLRGTDAFRTATRFGIAIAMIALFGGIWSMPFESASKWMLAVMCVQTIGSSFMLANHKRNQDTGVTFIQTLDGQK
jgi:hypothetical protein